VATRDTDWDGVRLHVVTGKGGTGKTTVAGALALALAANGKNVLLMEVEGRQGIAQLFDVPPLPYAERRIAVGLGTRAHQGGDVFALSGGSFAGEVGMAFFALPAGPGPGTAPGRRVDVELRLVP